MLNKIRTLPWRQGLIFIAKLFWKRLHIPIIPFLLVLMLECFNRRSFAKAWEWVSQFPNEASLNYWIALFLTLLLAGAVGRTRYTYALLVLSFGAVGWISGMKINQTGAPLYLWEAVLPTSGDDPAKALNPAITTDLLLVAAAAAGALLVVLLIRELRLNWRERAVYGALSLFLLSSVHQNFPIAFWDIFHIVTIRFDQERNYTRNGYLLATFDGIDFVRPEKPAVAGDGGIRKLVDSLRKDTANPGPTGPAAPGPKPNVIVLLSETFWDPTLMANVKFSEDPIPFFHSLMRTATSGWMLSPQFGGTTANVEFEVLSGNSMRFLPQDSIAYINYLNRGVDSLGSIFARDGYTSTAINPFYNWFFNSRNVYRNLGFSRFISSEFFEPRYHGPWLEDSQVMEKIIETTEATSGPDFVFANTMENHGGYEDKYYSNPIKVSGPISDKTKNLLENYATGEQAFDKAFKTLVDHYAKQNEPTVILCFGDHLPGLGNDYFAYKDAGYITGANDPAFMDKMHYLPFVIWDSTGSRPKESLRMSASFLGAYLLHYIGQPGTYYTDFLYDLYRKQPVIPIRPFRKQHPIDESLLADYKRLQYDILFGAQVGYQDTGIRGRVVPERYGLGYGGPKLDKAVINKDGKLEVSGDLFSDECTLWLNGTKLDSTRWNTKKMTARLPEAGDATAFPWHLQVRLIDMKNTVIAESEALQLDAPPTQAP